MLNFLMVWVCLAGSHLAPGFRASLFVGTRYQLRGFKYTSVLGGRRLCHSFEQSDGLALGPAASDPLPDRQRGQRVGESVGGLHGTPVGL